MKSLDVKYLEPGGKFFVFYRLIFLEGYTEAGKICDCYTSVLQLRYCLQHRNRIQVLRL